MRPKSRQQWNFSSTALSDSAVSKASRLTLNGLKPWAEFSRTPSGWKIQPVDSGAWLPGHPIPRYY